MTVMDEVMEGVSFQAGTPRMFGLGTEQDPAGVGRGNCNSPKDAHKQSLAHHDYPDTQTHRSADRKSESFGYHLYYT